MKKLISLFLFLSFCFFFTIIIAVSCKDADKETCAAVNENYSAYERYYSKKNFALALTSINNVLSNYHEYSDAENCILRRISKTHVHNLKAEILLMQKKYIDGIKSYSNALKEYKSHNDYIYSMKKYEYYKDSDFIESYIGRSYCKYYLGDIRGAIIDCNIADDTIVKYQKHIDNKTAVFLYSNIKRIRGNSFFKMKKYDSALIEYEWIVANNPDVFADIYINKGIIEYTSLVMIDKACLDFSKAGELGDKEAYDYIKKYCN